MSQPPPLHPMNKPQQKRPYHQTHNTISQHEPPFKKPRIDNKTSNNVQQSTQQMVQLSNNNNQLPPQILHLLPRSQSLNSIIPIGKYTALLYGHKDNQKYAIPGNVNMSTFVGRNNTAKISVLTSKSQVGETDKIFSAIFYGFINKKTVILDCKITPDNTSKLQTKINRHKPNMFVRKLQIEISAQINVIPSLLSKISICAKKSQRHNWIKTTPILKYFQNMSVSYDELYAYINKYIPLKGDLQSSFEEMFKNGFTADDLYGIEPNKDIIVTELLSHQKIGVEWMCLLENFENDNEILPFYEEIDNDKCRNIISNEELQIDDLPEYGCGGILADDMGCGKTLQCISLIATNSGFDDGDGDEKMEQGPTLIICPVAVMSNWEKQIERHCVNSSFKVMKYHGSDRIKDVDVINKYDIVITTYGTVASEYMGESDKDRELMRRHVGLGGLQYVDWLRVVLDEAHKIRSKKTKIFKACSALQAKSRWCLTGTPVQNGLNDLYSLFCFLRLQPICDNAFWKKFIIEPIKKNNESGFDRLRQVMKTLCLRRDKSMGLFKLPNKNIICRELEFIPSERVQYEQLFAIQKQRFIKLKQIGDKEIMRNYGSVLSMILRLRQCCGHILLVPQSELNGDIDENILNLDIAQDSNQECSECGMAPDQPVLTICNHIYCNDCFLYQIENNKNKFPCALCGEQLTKNSITPLKNINDLEHKNNSNNKPKAKKKKIVINGDIEPSTKIRALIDDIKSWKNNNGEPDKAVVFSQWTSMLDILQYCLDKEDIMYERLDGSMSASKREIAMDRFRKNKNIQVFLMSLKAGCLGIDMTVANHVYMFDPWWNPATEDQAVDRVYRLGQKRNVTINKFIIKGSVEEKILDTQKKKRETISKILSRSDESSKQKRRIELLRDLNNLFDSD